MNVISYCFEKSALFVRMCCNSCTCVVLLCHFFAHEKKNEDLQYVTETKEICILRSNAFLSFKIKLYVCRYCETAKSQPVACDNDKWIQNN